MKAAMSKAARTERDFGYVTIDGYALISDSQPHAEAVLAGARQGTLAKSEQYRADLKSLHGDQIARRLGRCRRGRGRGQGRPAAPRPVPDRGPAPAGQPGGRGPDHHRRARRARTTSRSRPSRTGRAAASTPASTPVNGTLAKLSPPTPAPRWRSPASARSLSQAWDGASAALGLGSEFSDFVDQTGLQLPDDLAALFGTDITVSAPAAGRRAATRRSPPRSAPTRPPGRCSCSTRWASRSASPPRTCIPARPPAAT